LTNLIDGKTERQRVENGKRLGSKDEKKKRGKLGSAHDERQNEIEGVHVFIFILRYKKGKSALKKKYVREKRCKITIKKRQLAG
jgi:C4-type Zn-finger protein